MQDRYRALSIDTLLTRPLDAIRMACDAAYRAGELSKGAIRQVDRACQQIETSGPATVTTITEMLRTAIANRKRGGAKRDRV